MKRSGFTMQLKPGFEAEYKKRHDEIWPELSKLLVDEGILKYEIFLEPTTLRLFAYTETRDDYDGDHLARQPIMRKWWDYMADIMDVNPDNSPVCTPLPEVFRMG